MKILYEISGDQLFILWVFGIIAVIGVLSNFDTNSLPAWAGIVLWIVPFSLVSSTGP